MSATDDEEATAPEGPRHRGLDPQMLYGWSLLGGLALAWPALNSAMHGETDILTAGIRLLVSVAVLWAGLHLVNTLIGNYALGVGRATTALPPVRVGTSPEPEGRRRDDTPALDRRAETARALESAPESTE